jgi:hypothetical protein
VRCVTLSGSAGGGALGPGGDAPGYSTFEPFRLGQPEGFFGGLVVGVLGPSGPSYSHVGPPGLGAIALAEVMF